MRTPFDFTGPIGAPEGGCGWSLGLHNLLDAQYRVHGSGFDAPASASSSASRVNR